MPSSWLLDDPDVTDAVIDLMTDCNALLAGKTADPVRLRFKLNQRLLHLKPPTASAFTHYFVKEIDCPRLSFVVNLFCGRIHSL